MNLYGNPHLFNSFSFINSLLYGGVRSFKILKISIFVCCSTGSKTGFSKISPFEKSSVESFIDNRTFIESTFGWVILSVGSETGVLEPSGSGALGLFGDLVELGVFVVSALASGDEVGVFTELDPEEGLPGVGVLAGTSEFAGKGVAGGTLLEDAG